MGLVWVSYLQIGVYLHQSWLRDCRLVFTTWQNCSISHLHKINPVFGDICTPSHLMRVCFARVKIKLILPRFCWVYVNYTTHWAWSGLWSFPIYFPIWSQYWFRLSRTSPLSTVNPLPCAAKKRENVVLPTNMNNFQDHVRPIIFVDLGERITFRWSSTWNQHIYGQCP